MDLTNPGRTLRRSFLLLISQKLSTLSGILLFSTNSFRLAFLLALLVGLNLSFVMSVLVWFIKITKFIPIESIEVFHKYLLLSQYFYLYLPMISQFLCLLPPTAPFMLMIWPFGSPAPRSSLLWRPHKEL